MDDLSAAVLRVGRDAGLEAVGIAVARPFPRAREAIESRIADGLHGGMSFTFKNPAKSSDPTTALPGAATLVVGARSYERADVEPPPKDRGPVGRVARYTWADRYAPLKSGLHAVSQHLREQGWRTRVLVDDNALMDREAAYQAGLGWYGKNANLLLPGRGSWFLLGSVVTTAPLSPTSEGAMADGCGSCERCLPACPTGAIVSPGVVDARRCLSWLLQAPDWFPYELRAANGDRLYGCDDCQEACPPNRVATRRHTPPPADPQDQAWVALLDILRADDRELLESYGRWYLPGREAKYLRRNALVALGNSAAAGPEVEQVLRSCLAHTDPMVRGHAVWAAARLGHGGLLDSLRGNEADARVRVELTQARSTPLTN